jgi:hypothetical protein
LFSIATVMGLDQEKRDFTPAIQHSRRFKREFGVKSGLGGLYLPSIEESAKQVNVKKDLRFAGPPRF